MLLGERHGSQLWLRWVWPCLNRWQPEPEQDSTASRCNRFSIDPGELVAAQRWGRERGWLLLGSAHSHPSGAVTPSAIDLAWGWDGCLMLIRGYAPEVWGMWWLSGEQDQLEVLPLPWTQVLGK